MILVDTSVWIEHLRTGHAALGTDLNGGDILMHPFILGELACGNLKNRQELLALWSQLPMALVATEKECLTFIERHRLMGRGIGYIDVHLLVAVALDGRATLLTHDKRLQQVAVELKLAARQDIS